MIPRVRPSLETALLGESNNVDGGELGALGRLGRLAVRGGGHFPGALASRHEDTDHASRVLPMQLWRASTIFRSPSTLTYLRSSTSTFSSENSRRQVAIEGTRRRSTCAQSVQFRTHGRCLWEADHGVELGGDTHDALLIDAGEVDPRLELDDGGKVCALGEHL